MLEDTKFWLGYVLVLRTGRDRLPPGQHGGDPGHDNVILVYAPIVQGKREF